MRLVIRNRLVQSIAQKLVFTAFLFYFYFSAEQFCTAVVPKMGSRDPKWTLTGPFGSISKINIEFTIYIGGPREKTFTHGCPWHTVSFQMAVRGLISVNLVVLWGSHVS